jgi:hypothetical protein
MFHYDDETRRQLCRERADTLARDYRCAQPLPRHDPQLLEGSRSLASRTLSLLRHLRRRHVTVPGLPGVTT